MIMFLRLNRSAANRAVTVALQAEKKSCLLNSFKTRDVAFIDLHQLCETLERYRYIVRSLLIPTDRLDKSFLLNETGLRRIAGERELPFQLSKLCLQGLQLVVEFGDIRAAVGNLDRKSTSLNSSH